MINFDEYLKYSIISFILFSIILWIKKPLIIFEKNGKIRDFGIGNNKTIFYYPIVILVFAIFVYTLLLNLYLRKSINI